MFLLPKQFPSKFETEAYSSKLIKLIGGETATGRPEKSFSESEMCGDHAAL
jgi:hypothetical protein